MNDILSVENLTVDVRSGSRRVPILREVSLAISAGERLAIVGESGCGKTTLLLAAGGLLPHGTAIASGTIHLHGRSLAVRDRGYAVGMVFQDPLLTLDPVRRVGHELSATLQRLRGVEKREAVEMAHLLFREVSLPDPERIFTEYPHRLSGGERQRVMIALALAGNPEVLLADEPTAAMDSPVAMEILDLLCRLGYERGLALMLVTHDIKAARRVCSRAAVLYAGQIVEEGPAAEIFSNPFHPYTQALRRCMPRLSATASSANEFPFIPGSVTPPAERRPGCCAFAPRCDSVFDRCGIEEPAAYPSAGRRVRCFLRDDTSMS